MGLIPDDVLDEIKQRTDIVAVIGRHVGLRKAGRNHKGLCPFHNEKTPSFNVNADKGFFICFGCQKKGDVLDFVMEIEGRSFIEAVESLALLSGVTLPDKNESPAEKRAEAEKRTERSHLLEINRIAQDLFRARLADAAGAAGRAYLDSRGVSDEVAETFELGYAPDAWGDLTDHFVARKVSSQLAVTAGLIRQRSGSQGHYDWFRHRLVCPVMSPSGDIVGFSARALPDATHAAGKDEPPKYINSPENAVFKKSKLLYGLYQAREGIRKSQRAILVEGNFDVISMYQAGFTETVAPLGTALTDDQVLLLRRLTERVVLFYDGDNAGRAATLKALRVLVGAGLNVDIAVVPAGDDPDSLVQKGPAALARVLDKPRPGIEYFIHEIWSRTGESSSDYASALSEAAGVLASVRDSVQRDFLLGTFAAALRVPEDRLRAGLRQALRGQAQQAATTTLPTARNHTNSSRLPPIEEMDLLCLLADHPHLHPVAEELDVLSLLTDNRLQDMYSAALEGRPMWSSSAADSSPEITAHVLSGVKRSTTNPEHQLREAAIGLRSARDKAAKQTLMRDLEEARKRGNDALVRELLARARGIRQPKDS